MSLEKDNRHKLKDFFGDEYRSLKLYVNSKIRDTTNRSAEDIIQDVALKLFSGADRYAPINNVAGFVYRSIRNRIIDVMRASNTDLTIDENVDEISFSEILTHAEETDHSEQAIDQLKEGLERLKPEYRHIIYAVDFEGYSYKEISEETGIPQGTLMSRRHRALSILYKELEQEITN